MSQHDFVIDNQNAPASRSDINNALQALASCSSGTAAPVTTYANMLWYDTANDLLKIRNEANSAWITLGTVDQTNSVFNPNFLPATQAEAEAGTNNIKGMTALRVAQAIAALGGVSGVTMQGFISSGTYAPTAGYRFAIAIATGGGGGGGGSASGSFGGAGGNGGDTCISSFSLSGLAAQAVTIGAGGSGSSGSPTTGGNTTLGSIMLAKGGGSGSTNIGSFQIPASAAGGAGTYGSGEGGGTFWGSGGGSSGVSGAIARPGLAYGSGGGGGYNSSSTTSGGAGRSGAILILEFK